MNLLLSLRAEFRKTRRTASWAFALIAAAFVPVIFFLTGAGHDGVSSETLSDPWRSVLDKGFQLFGGAVLPLFVILCATLLPQVEYRNDSWKAARLTPQSPLLLFAAKYAQLLAMIALVLLAFNALLFAAVGGLQLRQPALPFGAKPFDWRFWLGLNGRLMLNMLGLSAFQFWLGLRFRNFLVPVAAGFGLWLTGLYFLFDSKVAIAECVPHVYPFISMTMEQSTQWIKSGIGSLVFFAGCLLPGFFDFRRRAF